MIMLNGLNGRGQINGIMDDALNLIPGVSNTINTVTGDIQKFETLAIQYATVTLLFSGLSLLVGIATLHEVRKSRK